MGKHLILHDTYPRPGVLDDALDVHVVGPPVVVAIGTAARPLPLGALARRRAGCVEHAPNTDGQQAGAGRFRLRFLGHCAHVDVVLLQAGIRIAQHDARQFLGVGAFQMLRHRRRIGQPLAARLELPHADGVGVVHGRPTGSGGGQGHGGTTGGGATSATGNNGSGCRTSGAAGHCLQLIRYPWSEPIAISMPISISNSSCALFTSSHSLTLSLALSCCCCRAISLAREDGHKINKEIKNGGPAASVSYP